MTDYWLIQVWNFWTKRVGSINPILQKKLVLLTKTWDICHACISFGFHEFFLTSLVWELLNALNVFVAPVSVKKYPNLENSTWLFFMHYRYRNLIERALRARLVYGSPHMNRAVSFEYMNRQLVWNEFSVSFILIWWSYACYWLITLLHLHYPFGYIRQDYSCLPKNAYLVDLGYIRHPKFIFSAQSFLNYFRLQKN